MASMVESKLVGAWGTEDEDSLISDTTTSSTCWG